MTTSRLKSRYSEGGHIAGVVERFAESGDFCDENDGRRADEAAADFGAMWSIVVKAATVSSSTPSTSAPTRRKKRAPYPVLEAAEICASVVVRAPVVGAASVVGSDAVVAEPDMLWPLAVVRVEVSAALGEGEVCSSSWAGSQSLALSRRSTPVRSATLSDPPQKCSGPVGAGTSSGDPDGELAGPPCAAAWRFCVFAAFAARRCSRRDSVHQRVVSRMLPMA